jgi:hypothetical protein
MLFSAKLSTINEGLVGREPATDAIATANPMLLLWKRALPPNLWHFVATHVLSPVSPVSNTRQSAELADCSWSSYHCTMTSKYVHAERVEHLLWLTTATKSLIVPDLPDLTDPESCHKSATTFQTWIHQANCCISFLSRLETPKPRSVYPSIHMLNPSS